jgi:hypothetical protein
MVSSSVCESVVTVAVKYTRGDSYHVKKSEGFVFKVTVSRLEGDCESGLIECRVLDVDSSLIVLPYVPAIVPSHRKP